MRSRLAIAAAVALILGVAAVKSTADARTPERRGSDSPTAAVLPQPRTYERSIEVDGRRRTYRVYVPASADGQSGRPVVVALHGGLGNAENIEKQSKLSELADGEGFIAVYPDGTGRLPRRHTWNADGCCGYAHQEDVDDVKFIGRLLDAVTSEWRTDQSRVYVTGLSNGGMMTYRVGCELADRVTAIAVVAGSLTTDSCEPSRPLPVLIFHGTADKNIPYEGGEGDGLTNYPHRSVADAVDFWTGHNRCTPKPVTTRQDDWTRSTYLGCADDATVTLYTIHGGGHAWPGGTRGHPGADDPNPGPDASAVMWEFFAPYSGRP